MANGQRVLVQSVDRALNIVALLTSSQVHMAAMHDFEVVGINIKRYYRYCTTNFFFAGI